MKGILKSVEHNNNLFLLAKTNPDKKSTYKKYRNQFTKIIRKAKFTYHQQILLKLKNKSRKL